MTPKPSFALLLAAALTLWAPQALAVPQPTTPVDMSRMLGRWYEVARYPNKIQKDCQAATSDWKRLADGYSVIQTCHKGAPTGPTVEWKAKARVSDPVTNAKFKMSFFGGMVNQEYWVLDHRPDQGWLILGTPGGRGLWLMSTRPTLPPGVRSQAIARIRQLGYDAGLLEFPQPVRN